ncbi:MAG TPA: NUDIX hydrolase, partial [Aggregatilineales bacterium]|nr:NUDIX hydrolase [Aggregatilineales bacterium]
MWKILNREILIDAMPWVRVSTEHVQLPNGVEIRDFYRVDITPYVMIFALTDDHRVALLEHYRHGPQTTTLDLPAGYIENDDDALETARRELREETGLVSENWLSFGKQFIDGNRGCGWVYCYLARDARIEGKPQPEATEIMTVHLKTLNE